MFRTLGIAATALIAGLGIGLTTGAGADQPRAVLPAPRTPVSCLLALESAWKTINQAPPGTDHEAEFDASYADCLRDTDAALQPR